MKKYLKLIAIITIALLVILGSVVFIFLGDKRNEGNVPNSSELNRDDKDAGIVTGKYKYPEEVAKCPMSKNGDKYVYEAYEEEFVMSTNIWDFIDVSEMSFDFLGLIKSLGYNNNSAYDLGENEIDWCRIFVTGRIDPSWVKASYRNKEYEIKYSSKAMPWTRFHVGNGSRMLSEEMIILLAYAAENMINNPGSVPLGNHLQKYFYDYGEKSGGYELP